MSTTTRDTAPFSSPTLHVRAVEVRGRLQTLDLHIVPGTLTCVVGENGAGKSTLLDVLSGVLRPHVGAALLGGTQLHTLPARARAQRIASLGATPVEVECTVEERIAQGLAPRRGSAALVDAIAAARIREMAAELAVAHLLERELPTLSQGERRRVDVARALVDGDAEVYILDEPHGAVDMKHQACVSDALRARARAGKTVVVSVHDLGLAAAIADDVVGLKDGRVVVQGPPAQAFTSASIEALYGVRGARVLCQPEGVAILLPRGPPTTT